ncbi:MAG: sulfatase-like hydrolase/transferase [Acidobacteriota bacterium]
MPRRVARALTLIALAAVATSGCSRAGPARPVIVLISIDTLRADHLPAYGYRDVSTPAIDSLARDSVRFENAYSHVPLTLPSHAVLLTGLLPYENGVRDNLGFRLGSGRSTLASRLRARGYATGAAVSSWVLRADRGLSAGFDFYDDAMPDNATRERPGSDSVERLVRWADSVAGKPLFLFLHLYEPHFPYSPPEPFRNRYQKMPYDGEIAAADQAVGRLLDDLKRRKLYDGAVILLVSDHGEGLGDHGEDEHGVFLYRETMRVPLFWKRPTSLNRGESVSRPVGLIDVVPTILSAARIPVPLELSGVPLEASRRKASGRRVLYAETFYPRLNFGWSDLASLTDDRFEYIEAPRPELYDIVADPSEKRDLATAKTDAFRSMRAALARISRPLAAPEAPSSEEVKKLASLGYVHVAAAAADSAARPDPKDRVATLRDFRRLLAFYYGGVDAEVIPLARRMTQSNPGILSVWTALAGSLERTGRAKDAAAALREGLTRSGDGTPLEQRAQAFDDLGRLLMAAGDRAGREAVLREAVAMGAASEEARRELARMYIGSQRPSDAVELLRLQTLRQPESFEVLGIALASMGRDSDARAALLRAWETAPGNGRVALNLGVLALHRSDAVDARAWLSQAVQATPDNAAAWADLGLAQAASGDEDAAAASWKRAVALKSDQWDAVFNLALFELKRGAEAAGRQRMERFLAVAPPQKYERELAEARRLLAPRSKA